MKVADKDVINPLNANAVPPKLHLRPFRAIHQKKPLVVIHHLGCWISFNGWKCRIAAQNCHLKYHGIVKNADQFIAVKLQ